MSVAEATLEIKNRLGLHLRAASTLLETVKRFKSAVYLSDGENEISARSIIGLMTLGAAQGAKLKVRVEGPDAREALEAIRKIFAERFGEE